MVRSTPHPTLPPPNRPMDFASVWQHLHSREWMWTFGRSAIEGTQLAQSGRVKVRAAELVDGCDLEITAHVTDTRLTLYETTVTLRWQEQRRVTILSRCLCPAGTLCKHAAALIAHASDQRQQAEIEDRVTRPQPVVVATTPPAMNRDRVQLGDAGATSPPESAAAEMVRHPKTTPRPLLVLHRIDAALPRDARSAKPLRIPVADPMVMYAGCPDRLPLTVRSFEHEWVADGSRHRMPRDLITEHEHLRELMLRGLEPFMEAHPGVVTSAPLCHLAVASGRELEFWKTFRVEEVPALQRRGWQVEISRDFGFDVIPIGEQHWITALSPDPGDPAGMTYALEMGIEVEGRRVPLIPVLAEAVQQGLTVKEVAEQPDTGFLFLVPELGERLISLPGRRLLPILAILHELCTPGARKKTALKVDRLRAAQLGREHHGLALQMPVELAALGERLQNFSGLPEVALPSGLRATLRPYQHEGLCWLQFLREHGLNGILADDMGLGKTVQTISHLLTEVESGRADRPSLIIAPTSVLRNWASEIKRFAPALRVMILHGDNRRERYACVRQQHVVITSYPLLIRDVERLGACEWHLAVLDEAHGIKNARAKAAQAACSLKARHRLCLTGTPMENHLGELWSLFHFLMPGLLGEQEAYRAFFRNPIEKKQDASAQQRLTSRLQPVLLRRTKDAVARDLPPKTEILNAIELDRSQADLYETIRAAVDKRVRDAIAGKGLERSQLVVLEALLKLRQVCCHPALLKMEGARAAETSAKTAFLMDELLPELLEEGRRILIFSQFTGMLALLEKQCAARGLPFVTLTGSTTDREKPVAEFQEGRAPLFFISLKAGGVGLNLTAADTVIHYDPWWNPAAEAQATDRAHRIGQTKPVFVHKLICQGTIEERIVEMQRRKSALITGLLTGSTEPLKLSHEDIKELLSPL